MRLSREAKAQRKEIEEGFLFSRDDQGIAKHFHVPHYEVAAMRMAFEERLAAQEAARITSEEWACTELKERIEALFGRWEKANGFQAGAGKILVPAGYNPDLEAKAA